VTSAESQALADIRGYALAGRIEVSPHAGRRMRERGVYFEDLRYALASATLCVAEPDERWKVPSEDEAGEELTTIVVIENGVVVVTLF
jgi:hypothetical protein